MNHEHVDADRNALERYRDYLILLASQQVGPRFRAKVDLSGIVQETLFEAQKQLADGFDIPSGRRLPWLRRILANNLGDELRRMTADKRDVRREVPLQQSVETSSNQLELWLARDFAPNRAIEREEQVLKLVTALARLPDAQRAALTLHYWSGQPLAEIAEHLDRSRDAVAGLIKRGVRQLRLELDEQDGEDD